MRASFSARAREALRALGPRGSLLLAGQVVAAGLSAVLVIVLARGLGAGAYGQFALISTSVYVITKIVDARIWEAATRFGSGFLATGEPGRARATLELGLGVNLLAGLTAAGLISLASALIAGAVLSDESLAGEVVLFSAVAPMNALQAAAFAILRVMDRFRALASLIAVGAALRLLAATIAVTTADSLDAALIALVCAEAAATVLLVGLTVHTLRRRLPAGGGYVSRFRSIRGELPTMARFVAASNATGTVQVLTTQADVLVVGLVADPATAGALKVAKTFVRPLDVVAAPYMQAAYPELVAEATRGRLDRFRALTWPASRAIAWVLAPLALVIAATSPLTVPGLVGPGFGEAPATIVPLAVAGLIGGALFWVQPAALALDLQLSSLRAMTIAAALQFALLLVLVPLIGAPGAGIAFVALIVCWIAIVLPRIERRAAHPTGDDGSIASVA